MYLKNFLQVKYEPIFCNPIIKKETSSIECRQNVSSLQNALVDQAGSDQLVMNSSRLEERTRFYALWLATKSRLEEKFSLSISPSLMIHDMCEFEYTYNSRAKSRPAFSLPAETWLLLRLSSMAAYLLRLTLKRENLGSIFVHMPFCFPL